MKLRVSLLLALALATAACSDRSATRPAVSRDAAGPTQRSHSMPPLPAAGALLAHRFAALPDRGTLVRYPAQPVVRQDGAYTWHRADLSEAHARAAVAGTLMLTSPSGESLRFRYSRHAEHPNGDWTWVGTSVDDASREAIITFGDKAAFGSIGQPGKEPLRLTIANGTSWLVETDPRQIAGIVNPATRPTGPDFFVAPEVASAVARRKAASGASVEAVGASTAAAAAASGTTVDVVIGYTNGFVSGLGGESQAQTRLNFLVDVTNEAYVNSQVNANVRLVKTVLVNYPDATSNDSALEELTGFRAPSTRTTPNAAFSALRAARDQYGADLVSLVRKFNNPENGGCGIAWLIGGGRSGIDQGDEFFGYSVVSDGRDAGTDGKTYFCRDETFAHELSHNMGSAHDRDTADGDDNVLQSNEYGAYEYSFGYKTSAAAGNFYTIMAYGDSGQNRYRVFSNPRVMLCGDLPCGIANQADNARSLNQTIPSVAMFRSSVVPSAPQTARNDFNGDRKSDVYWRNTANGLTSLWQMDAASVAFSTIVHQEPNQSWVVVATADFTGDGKSDVLWRNMATGENYLHVMNGAQVAAGSGALPTVSDLAWKIVAVGDFNADGSSDIYWRNANVGLNALWLMNGRAQISSTYVHQEPNPAWVVLGAGDFNRDGYADVFWRNIVTGQNYIHFMNGTAILASSGPVASVTDLQWKVVALADFNGDGATDLYWRNASTGVNVIWTMDGSIVVANQVVSTETDQNWTVANTGDYNGDGKADVFWRHSGNGRNFVHLMNGASILAGSREAAQVGDLAWKITGN